MTGSDTRPVSGRVAGLVARNYGLAESFHLEHLATDMAGIVPVAGQMVSQETRLITPGQAEVLIVSRPDWVERNVAAFAELVEPAERKLAERLSMLEDDAARRIARRLMEAETGALLGFLSRRVLGQYELVVPGEQGDSIAFVGANILQMERARQFRPSEFRMWIALHEAAHRSQFVGVGWLREYFLGLVRGMVESAASDEPRLAEIVARVRESRSEGRPMIDERGMLGLLATGDRRDSLDRVQALMSLLEGHGHVVMDRLGAALLPGQRRMSALLKARRSNSKTAWFFRLTGLEMKIKQYEMGERFVLEVERLGGWERLDHAWEGPDALPTLAEIEDPRTWLKRVG
ncbi:MAG: zinc-dependent metalloprotease [Acidimicrobiia bacterium]|nr:zinc-dependent metalloprotease [Acidimicrobiia bacterium]